MIGLHQLRGRSAASVERPAWTRARVIFGYFAADVRKRRRRLAAGMGFAVLYALARVAEPWPLKVVFDQVLFGKPARGWFAHAFTFFGSSRTDLLAAAGVTFALAGIVRGVAYYYEDYLLSSAAQEIVYAIRARLYRHLLRLPAAFHRGRPTGDTLVRLSSDIIMLRDVLVDAVVNLGTGVVLLVLMLAVMLAVDPVLTVFSVLAMPLVVVASAFYGSRIRVSSKRQRRREGQVAALMHEALASPEIVQLYGAVEREQERFQELNRQSLKQGTRSVRFEARMNRSVEFALAAGTVVVLWVGAARVLHGAITPGDLVVFISYLRAAYRPLRRASKSVQRSAKALAAAERIVEILATPAELNDAPDAIAAPPLTGRIGFESISFAYDSGSPVLDDVTVTIEAGATVAIVGASGSGKTTLVSLIPRMFDPAAGQVTVDGVDVRAYTLSSLREQISFVQQEAVLFGLTVADNIRYGHPKATDEEVEAVVEAAGLGDFIRGLPDGLETVVSERGVSLSGGQRQRVAIARALIRKTPILILDEPTRGLDTEKERDVLEAIGQLTQQATALIVTHDIQLVRDADDIIVLDNGTISARGTYTELRRSSAQFRRLAGTTVGARHRRVAAPQHAGSGPRALFYSHNGVGLGHLQRQLDLACAYRERHPTGAVLVVTGSHAASMFDFPEGIDFLKLPSLTMTDRYRNWDPRDLPLPREDVVALRRDLLEQTVRHFAPDLLVADFMPVGPYGELLPALETLANGGGKAVAGFRDVIDEPAFVRNLWQETDVYQTLRHYYAAICVYGDPAMLDFADAYGLDNDLRGRLHYCGYLGRPAVERGRRDRPFVIGACGGGADGAPLIEAFIQAAALLRPKLGGSWLAATGPLMPADESARLIRLGHHHGIRVERVVTGLREQVAQADCLVAMPGYNTVCDVLSYRPHAIFIPRDSHSREQQLRANRLAQWGTAHTVPAAALTGDRLARTVEQALSSADPPPAPVPLNGTQRALDTFDLALARALAA